MGPPSQQAHVGADQSDLNPGPGKVGVARQVQFRGTAFDTAQEQVLDRTLANGLQAQGILYPLVDFLLAEGLHQA